MKISRRKFLVSAGAAITSMAVAPALFRPGEAVAANGDHPNVIILLTDDQDVASLPVMRKLMQRPYGNWTTYSHAYANEARCCPSRAALLTGQYSRHHKVTQNGKWKPFDDTNTLATWMKSAGYKTCFLGKYFIGYPLTLKPPGWDRWRQKSGSFEGYLESATDFINTSVRDGDPFFLFMAFLAPHAPANPGKYARITPYVPPEPPNYNEADVSDKPFIIRKQKFYRSLQMKWRKERLNSQRALMMVDDGVQIILNRLNELDQLENTVVIFMGDNGFSWGSHRYIYKHLPYEECSRVPLMIRWPGQGGNREENRLVSNIDIAPTIAEVAGANARRLMDGHSLASLNRNAGAGWHESILLERGAGLPEEIFFGIREPGWMYAEYANGDKELYDLEADPYELVNIVKQVEYGAIRDQLAARMRELIDRT